jgi:hypothetical protein
MAKPSPHAFETIHKRENGKEIIQYVCTKCGAIHKGRSGFTLTFDFRGAHYFGKAKLCEKCTNVLRPLVEELAFTSHEFYGRK